MLPEKLEIHFKAENLHKTQLYQDIVTFYCKYFC